MIVSDQQENGNYSTLLSFSVVPSSVAAQQAVAPEQAYQGYQTQQDMMAQMNMMQLHETMVAAAAAAGAMPRGAVPMPGSTSPQDLLNLQAMMYQNNPLFWVSLQQQQREVWCVFVVIVVVYLCFFIFQ